eukprot:g9584.t1
MLIRRAYFDRLLLEEGESAEKQERERVQALWDEAEQHAGRKGGDFSLAWLQVPSVSEEHVFGFHERHGGMRITNLRLVGLGLKEVPAAIGKHLWSLKSLSLSSNALEEIPDGLCDLTALTELNLVRNKLGSLPDRSLTALHLASNRLNQLPDSICHLKTLKVLWLDHNFIAGLPMLFHQLGGLEKLMLEHNDMVYPPSEVVQQGCDRVRKWCYRRMHDRMLARQHTIVMAVQDILKQISERGLGDPSCFEPDVLFDTATGSDHFYALVYERLWDTMLPALEKEWVNGPPAPKGAITSFEYTRDEVDTVLVGYRDPTGRVLRRRRAMEREDIEFRVDLARRLVKESSETIEGKKAYTRKAIRMAEALKRKKEMGEFQSEAAAMKALRRQAVEKKFSKVKQSLNKEREHRLADLKLKVEGLQEELATLRGWGKEQKEAQIDQVLASMASLPEDKKLAEVEQQLEEEVEKLEQKASAKEAAKASKVRSKKIKRGDKEFQDLVDEMLFDLVHQDMDSAGEEARRKAEKEHEARWDGRQRLETVFTEWLGSIRSSIIGSSSASSDSASGFSQSESSSSEQGGSGSSATESGDESSDSGSEVARSSSATPSVLLLSDGENNDTTATDSRATTKRASSDGKTGSSALETVADADSVEAVALQLTYGDVREVGDGTQERALVAAEGSSNARTSETTASSPPGGAIVVGGDRADSARGAADGQRKKRRPRSKGLAVFLKDKAVDAYKDAEKLVQASDDGSSSTPSSLRTEKSLHRQKEWEIDHARVRARKLREERLKDFQQEEKIRREMAAIEAGTLSSSEATTKPELNEIMSTVGWDPEGDYTEKEIDAFARQAMKQLKEIGKDPSAELAMYGTRVPF